MIEEGRLHDCVRLLEEERKKAKKGDIDGDRVSSMESLHHWVCPLLIKKKSLGRAFTLLTYDSSTFD